MTSSTAAYEHAAATDERLRLLLPGNSAGQVGSVCLAQLETRKIDVRKSEGLWAGWRGRAFSPFWSLKLVLVRRDNFQKKNSPERFSCLMFCQI